MKNKITLMAEAANSGRAEKALDRLLVSAIEFYNDWKKGDFDLPELAELDMKAMANHFQEAKTALEAYDRITKAEGK